MSNLEMGFIGLIVFFVIMFLGVPISFSFIAVGVFGVMWVKGLGPGLSLIATNPFQTMTMYAWTCVPLFVFMGYLAQHTGIAEEFYEGVRRWVGQFRGGLAHAIIVANTGFGACTGDSIGAAVTFCTVSLPEMRKYKYQDNLTLGCVAASASLSQLIPPSLSFIVYGVLTQNSIGRLFMAGVFPGLVLAFLFLFVVFIWVRVIPLAGPAGPKTTWKEKIGAAPGMWSIILIFVVILGGLYLGIFTPTEAGGAGAAVVFLIAILRRKLTWKGLKTAGLGAGSTVAMVAFLLIGAMVFNTFLAITGVPQAIAKSVVSVTQSPLILMLIVIVIYFILGCFLDILAIVILTVPIFYPILMHAGWDPILTGVIIVVMMMLGSLTPPFGINVYAIRGVVKDVPLFKIFSGTIPFIGAFVVLVVLLLVFPQIATFLPGVMMGK
jgi:C4-dicarboxylate transporter, DctM subunit